MSLPTAAPDHLTKSFLKIVRVNTTIYELLTARPIATDWTDQQVHELCRDVLASGATAAFAKSMPNKARRSWKQHKLEAQAELERRLNLGDGVESENIIT